MLLIVQPRFSLTFGKYSPRLQLPNRHLRLQQCRIHLTARLRVFQTRLDLASCGLPDGLVEAGSR